MYELILYQGTIQALSANPQVQIVETASKRIDLPGRGGTENPYYHGSYINIIFSGDVRELVTPLGQSLNNLVTQMAEHRCTIQRHLSGDPKKTLESVVVQKINSK